MAHVHRRAPDNFGRCSLPPSEPFVRRRTRPLRSSTNPRGVPCLKKRPRSPIARSGIGTGNRAVELPCRGRIELVRLDPASTARSSLGPAAYGEYERVFGSRITGRWPRHLVLDGLDTIELLLDTDNLKIHPRCTRLKDAFLNYTRQRRRGEWIDFPAEGHPEEDMMDALRGGIRDALNESSPAGASLRSVHAARVLG
jgi:hypothetical protein